MIACAHRGRPPSHHERICTWRYDTFSVDPPLRATARSLSVFFLRGNHRNTVSKAVSNVLYYREDVVSHALPQGFGSFSRSFIRNGGPPAPYSANTSSRCSAAGTMWGSGMPCIVDGIGSPCSVSSVGLATSMLLVSSHSLQSKHLSVAYTTSIVDTSDCSRQPWEGRLGCPSHDTINGTRVRQS